SSLAGRLRTDQRRLLGAEQAPVIRQHGSLGPESGVVRQEEVSTAQRIGIAWQANDLGMRGKGQIVVADQDQSTPQKAGHGLFHHHGVAGGQRPVMTERLEQKYFKRLARAVAAGYRAAITIELEHESPKGNRIVQRKRALNTLFQPQRLIVPGHSNVLSLGKDTKEFP